MPTIKVVGAGFSGLTTAYFLVKRGFKVQIIEKTSRAGGLIETLQTEHGLVEKAANGILFHARTATYVARQILEEVYDVALQNGYHTIVGFEPFGMSRMTGKPYEFSTTEKESIAYLWGMIIHNYPAILRSAGYELVHLNVLKIDHPHEDLRQLEFVARAQA